MGQKSVGKRNDVRKIIKENCTPPGKKWKKKTRGKLQKKLKGGGGENGKIMIVFALHTDESRIKVVLHIKTGKKCW